MPPVWPPIRTSKWTGGCEALAGAWNVSGGLETLAGFGGADGVLGFDDGVEVAGLLAALWIMGSGLLEGGDTRGRISDARRAGGL
jgi:hypothetical protein